MTAKYPLSFSPIKIGPVTASNRLYSAPHGNPLNSSNSTPSEDFAHYNRERMQDGVGLAIHSLPVTDKVIGRMSPYPAHTIDSFAALSKIAHDEGSLVFGQLHYGWIAQTAWEPFGPLIPHVGPSVRQKFDHPGVVHSMGYDEIDFFVRAYEQSSRHLAQANYDGVEVHVSHGFIAEMFLSPHFNSRSDRYGGDLAGRMRFLRELLAAARRGVGDRVAVGVRLNCDEQLPTGLGPDDLAEVLSILVADGLIDFADLDIAIEPNQFELGMPPNLLPEQLYKPYVAAIRDAAGHIPVLSALSRITSVKAAEAALAEGVADMIGIARGLIAEPQLVSNAKHGREDRSRICIACNWCLQSGKSAAFGCAINPASSRERRWGLDTFTPAARTGTVVVVGGGGGGMEAARVASLRGHRVVLFEENDRLGGQLLTWAKLPGREIVETTATWYASEMRHLGVEVRLGKRATADDVLAENPLGVIVATGGRYVSGGENGGHPTPVPMNDSAITITPEELLDGRALPTGTIVVLDDEGLNTAPGIAELLAVEGADVHLVTRWSHPAQHLSHQETPVVLRRIKGAGVQLHPFAFLNRIEGDTVVLEDVHTGAEEAIIGVRVTVFATMRAPVDELVEQLRGRVEYLFAAGDALSPRTLGDATYEGQRFAREIGAPDGVHDFAEAFAQPLGAEMFARPAGAMFPAGSLLRKPAGA